MYFFCYVLKGKGKGKFNNFWMLGFLENFYLLVILCFVGREK